MDRRGFLALAGAGVIAGVSSGTEVSAKDPADVRKVDDALRRFRALPGTSSYLIEVGRPGPSWRTAHKADVPLFVGSSVKTFILAKFLQDQEAGLRSSRDTVVVDDSVRSIASPVFIHLTGKTLMVSALEAMIAHSDNTGTDIALKAVGPIRVRKLIADAGYTRTLIPESTRVLFSYIAGAPAGVDGGWAGMRTIMKGGLLGPKARFVMNHRATMISTSSEMVNWYQRSLRGEFFQKPETLVEYKRIQSQADALYLAVPTDTVTYGKGGSINWEDEHALSLCGQMLLGVTPVTFAFSVNWVGPDDGIPAVFSAYAAAAKDALHGVAAIFG